MLAGHTSMADDLSHQVFGQTQVLQSLMQGFSSPLSLALVALEALVRFEATTLSGFGVLFGVSLSFKGRPSIAT